MFTEMWALSGAEILAVDLAPELIARARARDIGQRVRFAAQPFEACDAEGPFDAIVGSSILHHLEVRPALQRLHQLLTPGGRIAFAEPNMLNPQVWVTKNVPWIKKAMGDSPDETAFIAWQLTSLLREAGFRKVRVSPFDFLHPSTPPILIETVSRVGRVLERLPVIRSIAGSLLISAVRE
jgi:SAM-dependent methyltransferase